MRTKKLNSTIAMLKDYRESNQLTYQELAEQMNMDDKKLNHWLTGRVIPRDTSLKQVEDFLNAVHARQFVEIAEADKTYIDSRLVAQWIGKAHRHLLQDIRGYIEDLNRLSDEYKGAAGIFAPPEKVRDNNPFAVKYYFMESSYIHPQNKTEYPCYLVSKLGCEMIAHKMTGLKGTKFTALYINEFHRMKDNEQAKAIDHERKPAPRLEDDPTFSREAIERRLSSMTQEQRNLNYIRNALIEVSKGDDIDTIIPKMVKIAKMINLMREMNEESYNSRDTQI